MANELLAFNAIGIKIPGASSGRWTQNSPVSTLLTLELFQPFLSVQSNKRYAYNGSLFVQKPVNVWNGSSWQEANLKVFWDTSFVP